MVMHKGVELPLGYPVTMPLTKEIEDGTYESAEADIFLCTVESQDTVMEIGTGLGLLATLAARRVGNRKVYTYEPNPRLEAYIRGMFAMNDVDPYFIPEAVCYNGSEATFHVSPNIWSSSLIRHKDVIEEITVPARPFQVELNRFHPTYLICDAEGSEVEFLGTGDLGSIQRILIEFHEGVAGKDKTAQVKGNILGQGFQLDPDLSRVDTWFLRRK